MGLKRKGRAATGIVTGGLLRREVARGGAGAAPTICSSHHHHRPDGNLIAAVGVTGLCVIEMKRRATPLERNYYYHLCVYEYVVCTCHNHQKPQSQSQSHRSRSGAKARPAGAISHQPLPLFSHCARHGAAWFGFVFCLLFFIPLLMLYATLCAVLAALIST